MAGLTFSSQDAAERLEQFYFGRDIAAQRADTLLRLGLTHGEQVLDVGSGPGFLAEAMANQVGPQGQVVGVDISDTLIDRSAARNDRPWLTYRVGDATALAFGSSAFDVVASTQVAEYISDTAAFLAELVRVLRPGGRALVLTTDWGGVLWHSERPDRMAEVLQAFEGHCAHATLPRVLAPAARTAGLTLNGVSYFPIVNTSRYEGAYSLGAMTFIQSFVEAQGAVAPEEVRAWADEQAALDARGAYFFASGRFSFLFSKT